MCSQTGVWEQGTTSISRSLVSTQIQHVNPKLSSLQAQPGLQTEPLRTSLAYFQ